MSTKIPTEEERIGQEPATESLIVGPLVEPLDQGGASFWRCADCGRESLRRQDLKRAAFHAKDCLGAEH